MKNWFLKTQRIFETQTNATVGKDVLFGLRSILKEVRPSSNGNLILSYDYEISLNGKSIIPQVEKIDIPDYTSTVDESVIMQEEYFAAFMTLYKSKIPLQMTLTTQNFPDNLPFNLYVKDFIHIVFGLDKYDDYQELGIACDWGKSDSMVNITVHGLEGNVPLDCKLFVDQTIPKVLLNFNFTLQVTSTPTILELIGGQYIHFSLKGVKVMNYDDDQPGNVIDKYMMERIKGACHYVAPADIIFFDKRLDTMQHVKIGFEDHYVKFTG